MSINGRIKLVTSTETKTLSKRRTIHAEKWDLEKYLDIFHIPKYSKKETTDWFLNCTKGLQERDEIRVLSPGVGNGRNELLLIESLSINYDKPIICDFIDYSETSCSLLAKALLDFNYTKSTYSNTYCKKKIKVNVIKQDYVIWLDKYYCDSKHTDCLITGSKCYDLILAFFIINFLPDWRVGLIKTCDILKPGGMLFISQDINDLCYLDNTFSYAKNINEKEESDRYLFSQMWVDYFELRQKHGLDWNSLISPSNMDLVRNIFNDIHFMTGKSNVNNSQDIIWSLQDLKGEIPDESLENFKSFKFWYNLIEGNNNSNKPEQEIFNCLYIAKDIRRDIVKSLKTKYSPDTKIKDLKFGQKLFYLIKSESLNCEQFINIVRYSTYSNSFSSSSIADFKSINRRDMVDSNELNYHTNIKLKYHFLNRLLDVYNTLIQNKDKSMLSMFSRELQLDQNGIDINKIWRTVDIPKIFPNSFLDEEKENFIKSYALYFIVSDYLKDIKKVPKLITDLIQTNLSKRIGIIYTVTNRAEGVKPIYYHNSLELKAVLINLSKRKCEELKNIISGDVIGSIKLDNEDIPKQNYYFIETTRKVKEIISNNSNLKIVKDEKGKISEKNDFLENIINKIIKYTDDFNFSEEIYKILLEDIRHTINNSNLADENPSEFENGIKERFKYIYAIALSHYVDCNIIAYTSTNTELNTDLKNIIEEGFYGLILSDNAPFVINEAYSNVQEEFNEERLIENYYDQLVANTFTYSGMDGLKENRKIRMQTDTLKYHFATKAAISQVMARNMSHNIGSHVLAKMVRKELRNEYKLNNQYKPFKDINKNIDNDFDFLLSWFNSYLRNRMDFLADISTGIPVMEVTKFLFSDIISQFDRNRLLLDRISGVDKMEYSFNILDKRTNNNKNIDLSNDIPISIPNDSMGFQAFYIILENIIRNTAKHNSNNKDFSNKTFTIEIDNSPIDNSYYEILIYDYIKENIKGDVNDLVSKLNERLNTPIIDKETLKLRHGSWGLIEMKLSASYLRKITTDNIENKIYEIDLNKPESKSGIDKSIPHILKAVNKNNRLGYRFHFMKPKDMIIVDEQGALFNHIYSERKIDYLFDNGILLLHNSTEKDPKYKFNNEKVYPHPFMVIIASDKNFINNYILNDDIVNKPHFKYNLPSNVVFCCNNKNKIFPKSTFNLSRNVAICNDKDCKNLITAIKNCNVNGGDKFDSIKDLVWGLWLRNTFLEEKINKIIIEDTKDSIFTDYLNLPNCKEGKSLSLFFDHHGINIDQHIKCDYFEEYSSMVEPIIKKTLKYNDKGNVNESFDLNEIYKINDAIFTKILIVDERIQSAYSNKHYKHDSLFISEIMKSSGVFIPDVKELDLNRPVFDKGCFENLKKVINKTQFRGNYVYFDYIVIHLGVIEKILKRTGHDKGKSEILDFVKKIEKSYGKKRGVKIIVTSGRGQPDNLPKDLPFLPFSVLSQYAIEIRFKTLLNQAIKSARPLN